MRCHFTAKALAIFVAGAALFLSLAHADKSTRSFIPGKVRKTALTGEEIYKDTCAKCHGPTGEGVADKYDEPLYGDRSLNSLVKLISKTMPEDKPGSCTGENAQKVGEYIYHAFYSPEARARIKPPRIDLSRLTVQQYINSVADLQPVSTPDTKERGLKAQFTRGKKEREKEKDKPSVPDRLDSRVSFKFADQAPFPDMDPEEFHIKWRGSVLVEETGHYEFAIKTENGARLFINDEKQPLIDAWVSSGQFREEKQTIFLLGGRAYPLQLDFFKFKDKTASIELLWKPPHKAWEVIPERNLIPVKAQEVLVVSTPFPADDSSQGYERGTSVSKAWDRSTTFAAVEIANKLVDKLGLPNTGASDNQRQRVKDFSLTLIERAYRRPLSEQEKEELVVKELADGELKPAAKRIFVRTLKSPEFLYVDWGRTNSTSYDVAARLALTLWDSLPDKALLAAAEKGELKTREQVRSQGERMLKDPRARTKINGFFRHWLEMDEAEDISKDPSAYPDFNEHVLADLRQSLEIFIEEVVWSEKSDYRDLLLADYIYVNGRLAKFYGIETSANDEFEKVSFDRGQRSGVITHPFLLTAFAYHKSSSPIHRGVFLTRNIVGRALKPPPMAIQFMDNRFDPSLTMREKVSELTRPVACHGCHAVINPLGFSLENFDAVGRFRTHDNKKPVNARGEYVATDGTVVKLSGPRDLAEYASKSKDAHRGFIRQLFEQSVRQPPAAYGRDTITQLDQAFTADNFNIQKLMLNIAETSSLHGIERKTE